MLHDHPVAAAPLIAEPGAYPDIDIEDYHRNPNLLPGPSLSASGAKTIINKSPFHFWSDSPLNPNPPEREEKPHFAIGKMAHDWLLTPDRIGEKYHITPAGFNESYTKKFAAEIEEVKAAREAGKTILKFQEAETVQRVADAIGMNDVAKLAMKGGDTEVTLAWQDKETGVWLRCRPDFLPSSVRRGAEVRAVSDLKFMAPEYCSPHGFSNAIRRFGYHLAAAFYFEGIAAIYGHAPTHWIHIIVEKEFPFSISLYPLPQADIERGKHQMRMAVRRFADCLAADRWPSYADEPTEVGLHFAARKTIDFHGSEQDAALINAQEGVA